MPEPRLTAKEIEILVRHQLAVLRRPNRPPRLGWADPALIAALTRLLPVHRRLGLLVTPSTILRWHRQLVARGWTTKPRHALLGEHRACSLAALAGDGLPLVLDGVADSRWRTGVAGTSSTNSASASGSRTPRTTFSSSGLVTVWWATTR